MVRYIPLIDGSMVLQAAVTKAVSFNGPAMSMGDGYAPGGLGQPVGAVVEVTALVHDDADETYAMKLQQSADGITWADAGAAVAVTEIGTAVVPGLITAEFVRLVVTIGGTTPSVTYSAMLGF